MTEQLRFGKTVAILLSGKAGVGKTTTANFLWSEYAKAGLKAGVFSFANGVKATAKFLGWNGEKDEKGRKLLQQIGAAGREYSPDTWVARTLDRSIPSDPAFPLDVIIVDDYRFPNESNYIRLNPLYQVFEIRIHAPEREILKGTEAYFDASEVSLPGFREKGSDRYFATIWNSGTTLEDLQLQAHLLVERINSHTVKWQ